MRWIASRAAWRTQYSRSFSAARSGGNASRASGNLSQSGSMSRNATAAQVRTEVCESMSVSTSAVTALGWCSFPSASQAASRTSWSASFSRGYNASTIPPSLILPIASTAALRTAQCGSFNAPASGMTALRSNEPNAPAAAARMPGSWSLRHLIKSGTQRGSRVSFSASTAAIRTDSSVFFSALSKVWITRSPPIYPSASMIPRRLRHVSSLRHLTRASIAISPSCAA